MAEMIKINGKDIYYIMNGVKYVSTFPQEWAANHIKGTGPHECNNCKWFGTYGGVFIGYCANCADYKYHSMRGYGFIEVAKELDSELPVSATATYLKGIDLEQLKNDAISLLEKE